MERHRERKAKMGPTKNRPSNYSLVVEKTKTQINIFFYYYYFIYNVFAIFFYLLILFFIVTNIYI